MIRSLRVIVSLYLLTACSAPGTEQILTRSDGQDRHPSWSPDGQQIAFESDRDGNWEIYVINVEGSELRRLTRDTAADRGPSWHPDGKRILFGSNRDSLSGLYLLDIQTSRTEAIQIRPDSNIDRQLTISRPSWGRISPDGNHLLFNAEDSLGVLQLFVANMDGSAARALTDGTFRSVWGNWSPDSDRVVFHSRVDTQGEDDELYIIRADGTGRRRVTRHPTHNFCPDWVPGTSRIIHSISMPDSRPELFLIDRSTGDTQRLTFNEDGDTEADASPDGSMVVFACYRGGNYRICRLSLD